MTLREQQSHFIRMVAQLIQWVDAQGWELTGGELYRTKEQQEIYLQTGKSKTRNSRHLRRLAIDVNLFINGRYQTTFAAYEPLGAYWRSLDAGNVWGGDWPTLRDCVHFEYAGK